MTQTDLYLSVDLVQSALSHLRFLDRVDNLENILKGDVLKHALKRYEQLWLPFAYKNKRSDMMAPVDIAWLWYIHMLQPLAYRKDCRKLFNDTLDHEFRDRSNIIPCTNKAIEKWYDTYPKEGFNIIRNEEYVKPRRNKGEIDMDKASKLSFDLIAAAEVHMHFAYQVALPHFRDKLYLESALCRYKQFLYLKRMEPDEFLTPSVDILLMWYTHMCHPVAYAKDMMTICGKLLANNVKVKPGPLNDRFLVAREKTNELWKKVSTEDLQRPGSKLRSNERRKLILPLTEDNLRECCIMVYKLCLVHAEVVNVPKAFRHFSLKISRAQKNGNFVDEIAFLKGPKHMWTFNKPFIYNTVLHGNLQILLSHHRQLWCFSGDSVVAKTTVDMKHKFDNMGQFERVFNIDVDTETEEETPIRVELDGSVDEAKPVLCDLMLHTQPFNKEVLTKQALWRSWGQCGTPDSHRSEEFTTYIAKHSFSNHENQELICARVTHIPEMIHSGIEILYQNKLVAASRLIGSSQLPHSEQVRKNSKAMAFDPELGERAMLIRNHLGDWGVCVARWNKATSVSNASLEVRFMKLVGENKVQKTDIKGADIEFQSFNANLYSGKVMINPSGNVVAENLALFLSINVLYVLCSPDNVARDILLTSYDDASKLDEVVEENGEITPQAEFVQEDNCQFLVAAGLKTLTPSNQYVRKTYGSLTYDLQMDAQDIVVEELKVDRKLLQKMSKISLSEFEDFESPRRRKKKRLSSGDLKIDPIGQADENKKNLMKKIPEVTTPDADNVISLPGVVPNGDVATMANVDTQSNHQSNTTSGVKLHQANKQDEGANQMAHSASSEAVLRKQRKIKKRQSSKLEDMLAMSDDSITKEEVQEVKIIKNKGKKEIVKKISSNLNDEIRPAEDSLDEEENLKDEFFKGREDEDNEATEVSLAVKEEVKKEGLTTLHVSEELKLVKEETTLIKDRVEERRRQYAATGKQDNGLTDVENDRVSFFLSESSDNLKDQGAVGVNEQGGVNGSYGQGNDTVDLNTSSSNQLLPHDFNNDASPRESDTSEKDGKKRKRKKKKRMALQKHDTDSEQIKALHVRFA